MLSFLAQNLEFLSHYLQANPSIGVCVCGTVADRDLFDIIRIVSKVPFCKLTLPIAIKTHPHSDCYKLSFRVGICSIGEFLFSSALHPPLFCFFGRVVSVVCCHELLRIRGTLLGSALGQTEAIREVSSLVCSLYCKMKALIYWRRDPSTFEYVVCPGTSNELFVYKEQLCKVIVCTVFQQICTHCGSRIW